MYSHSHIFAILSTESSSNFLWCSSRSRQSFCHHCLRPGSGENSFQTLRQAHNNISSRLFSMPSSPIFPLPPFLFLTDRTNSPKVRNITVSLLQDVVPPPLLASPFSAPPRGRLLCHVRLLHGGAGGGGAGGAVAGGGRRRLLPGLQGKESTLPTFATYKCYSLNLHDVQNGGRWINWWGRNRPGLGGVFSFIFRERDDSK